MIAGTQALPNNHETWLYLACLDVLIIFSEANVGIIIYRTQAKTKGQNRIASESETESWKERNMIILIGGSRMNGRIPSMME